MALWWRKGQLAQGQDNIWSPVALGTSWNGGDSSDTEKISLD